MPGRTHRLLFAACAALLSSAAFAQEEPPPPPPPGIETAGAAGQNQPDARSGSQNFADPSQLFSGTPGAFVGVGFGKIDKDTYVSTVINTELALGPFAVGLGVPLNLLAINDDSTGTRDSKTYEHVLRRSDWNQAQDYLKFVRFVRYGHKREPLYLLAGQLWGSTLGHGTLVNRYSNSLSLDQRKFGIAFDFNSDYFGVETLVDNVAGVGILGGRAYVRPFAGMPGLGGLAFGFTTVVDPTAPLVPFATAPAISFDANGDAIVAQRAFAAAGVDVEYELFHNQIVDVIPYVDANRLFGAGNGLHAGALLNVRLPVPVIDVSLQTRLEYRHMQPGYIPEYFDQTYDLGRLQYAVTVPGAGFASKQSAAFDAKASGGKAVKGYYGELAFNFAGLVQVGGLLQDYEQDNGASLGLFATLPKFEAVKMSAYYLRKNFGDLGNAFELDERSLLAASAAVRVTGPVYLVMDFRRQWQVDRASGRVIAVDTYRTGIAVNLTF
ncbi:MAG TPA: hypothetical protein VKH65_16215 [Myxococcales bacterium]|nr:hypothetical protein [Myxococcales bacterium]